jgi:hypothetical protein
MVSTGSYRAGGGSIVAFIADAGFTAQSVVEVLVGCSGPCPRCGLTHDHHRWFRDAESLAREVNAPRREVRRACQRLTTLGVLESATEERQAWRLTEAARQVLSEA